MLSPKYVELFERLSERTEKGEARWEETASDEIFITFFRGFSLSLGKHWEVLHEAPPLTRIIATLRNERGVPIDTFNITEDDPHWGLLVKLFTMVRERYSPADRKAREVDAAVDTVLNQLRLAS